MKIDEVIQREYYIEKNHEPRARSSGTLTFKQFQNEILRKWLEEYLEKVLKSKPIEIKAREEEGSKTKGSTVSHGKERVQ